MSPNGVAVAPTIEADRACGLGRLCVTRQERQVQLPLAGVRIAARVADRVAQVTMEQRFHNPFAEALEAVYLFPLSGGAAVSAFEMKVGDRTIKGIVKERGEARRTYAEAIEQGRRAALLEQERDDVFTVQVGNLPPGEEVTVRIVYSEKLPFFENGMTQVGNEAAVFKRIQKDGGDTRIFTVGIDTAVNEAFLKRIASLGGGTCACVVPGEGLEDALVGIGREIGAPLVVNVKVDGVEELAPARVPDLFAGRAATVFFRVKNGKAVKVTGKYSDGKKFEETIKPREIDLGAIGHLWARSRVTDLEDRFRLGGDQAAIQKEIVELAVRHTLLTRFTAFVVVDEKEIVNKSGDVQKMVQPVHTPEGWVSPEEAMQVLEFMASSPDTMHNSVVDGPPALYSMLSPAPKVSFRKSTSRLRKQECRDDGTPAEIEKVSKSEEKAFKKALEALKKAIVEARARLDQGKVPAADAIEKARKALVKELAGSALGTKLAALQRFLRSALLELVAALEANAATSGMFAKCEKDLEEALRDTTKEERFWESTV